LPIRRILIANRGEIAVRIIRTCRELGIETVLAASEADRDSVPARLANRTVCIGPSRPTDSYLKVETILQAALGTKSDALHPGYGFLSERAALANLCETKESPSSDRPRHRSKLSATNREHVLRPRPPKCPWYPAPLSSLSPRRRLRQLASVRLYWSRR